MTDTLSCETPTPLALIIESDLVSRELLVRILRRHGLETHCAIASDQAAQWLADLQSPRYALVLAELCPHNPCDLELLRQITLLPSQRRPDRVGVIADSPDFPADSARHGASLKLRIFKRPVLLDALAALVARDPSA